MQKPAPVPQLPLRDIHLPEPISWWPPAPGWWIVAAITIISVFFIGRWLLRRHRRLGVYRAAMQALAQIESDFREHNDSKRLAQDISELLRRIAISITSRNTAAGLTGEEWLSYLDSIIATSCFNTENGRMLIEAPYKPTAAIDAAALLALCKTWVEQACKSHSKVGRHA